MINVRSADAPWAGNLRLEPSTLNEFQEVSAVTDRLRQDSLELPILGLYGEVGSLVALLKKAARDPSLKQGYANGVAEELGDAIGTSPRSRGEGAWT